MNAKDEHYGQATVSTSYGQMLIATTDDICVPNLSCGARGVALIAQGMDHTPTAREIADLTGDGEARIQRWINELRGTGYLNWED